VNELNECSIFRKSDLIKTVLFQSDSDFSFNTAKCISYCYYEIHVDIIFKSENVFLCKH